MASGTITVKTPSTRVVGYIKWSSEAGTATQNYSLVTAKLYLKKVDGYVSWGTFTGKLTINGTAYSFDKYAELGSSDVLIASKSGVKVSHNVSGAKGITISTSFSHWGTTIEGNYSGSMSVALDTIKRPSYLSGAISITAGKSYTQTINRYSTSFVHDVKITVGTTVAATASGVTDKAVFSSADYQKKLFTALAGSLSKSCTVTLTTRSGSTVVGTNTYTGTVTAPSPGTLSLDLSSAFTSQSQTVTVASSYSGYTYSAKYQFETLEGTIPLSGSPLTGTLSLGADFAKKIPANSNSAVCTVSVEAAYDGVRAGAVLQKTFTVSLTAEERTIAFDMNQMSCTFLNEDLTGSSEKFINNGGTALAVIRERATAKYLASVVKYELKMGSKSYAVSNPPAAGNIELPLTGGNGDVIEMVITDTRGNTGTWSKKISAENFIGYSRLKLEHCSVSRENGFDSTVEIAIKGTGWKGNFGLKENSLHIRYRIRKAGQSQWMTMPQIENIRIPEGGGFSYTYMLSGDTDGGFDPGCGYEIEAEIGDCLEDITQKLTVNSGLIGMYLKRNKDNYHLGVNCSPDETELTGAGENAGLSVRGEIELLSEGSKKGIFYTGTDGVLRMKAEGMELLSGGSQSMLKYLASEGLLKAGNLPVARAVKQGADYVELDLGSHYFRMNWGKVWLQPTANAVTTVEISFASGLFTDAPVVTVSPSTTVPGSAVKGVSFSSSTATGCKIHGYRSNTTEYTVHWHAISITKK